MLRGARVQVHAFGLFHEAIELILQMERPQPVVVDRPEKLSVALPKLLLKVVQVMESNFRTKAGLHYRHEAHALLDDVVEAHAGLQIQ
jgi:hypothetical protein